MQASRGPQQPAANTWRRELFAWPMRSDFGKCLPVPKMKLALMRIPSSMRVVSKTEAPPQTRRPQVHTSRQSDGLTRNADCHDNALAESLPWRPQAPDTFIAFPSLGFLQTRSFLKICLKNRRCFVVHFSPVDPQVQNVCQTRKMLRTGVAQKKLRTMANVRPMSSSHGLEEIYAGGSACGSCWKAHVGQFHAVHCDGIERARTRKTEREREREREREIYVLYIHRCTQICA